MSNIEGTSYDPGAPGPQDDKLTITLADGREITDTPLNIVNRAQAGEFKLPDTKTAETVADAHNDAVLIAGSDEFIEPKDLPVAAPEGNDEPSAASGVNTETPAPFAPSAATPSSTEPVPVSEPSVSAPGNTNSGTVEGNASPSAASADDGSSGSEKSASSTTDTSTAPSGPADTVEEPAAPPGPPVNVSAPGASTQIGSATTPSGNSQITEDNPVIPGTNAPPRPTGLEPPAPSPDANAASTGENTVKDGASAGVDAAYLNNPRAQPGSEVELTGEKALGQTSATEPSTWTPASPLAPQTPTTLTEATNAAHMAGGGSSAVEDRLAKLEARVDELEEDLTRLEDNTHG